MSFEELGLHPIIVRNLGMMGYLEPRPIQAQAIGPILEGRDLIGLAQAGSGKTAAYAAPIAHLLLTSKPPRKKGRPIDPMTRLRALVLCPTHELAQQVEDEFAAIAQGSVLRTTCAYGKVAITPQIEAIARGMDALIATPGRVRELIDAGALTLAYIRHVVIDEADRMLDMGFLPQVTAILQGIPDRADGRRQTLLFTATMPAEIEALAAQFLSHPVRIEIGRHTTPVGHVEQHLLVAKDQEKVPMLLHLLEHERRGGVVVFCRTRRRVGWVVAALERHNIKVGMIHGDRTQAQRKRALDRFAAGELRVLVATDVAARGLHIPAVKTVVNYDLPLAPEEYVHRIGRAAHGGGGAGQAYTLLSDEKAERLRWRAILDTTGAEVYAETLKGFKPAVTDERKAVSGRRRGTSSHEKRAPISRRELKRMEQRPRRSRKSRPIKKGQKPGRGVIRP